MSMSQPVAGCQDVPAPAPWRGMARVVSTRRVAPGVAATTLATADVARRVEPLQFVQVQVAGGAAAAGAAVASTADPAPQVSIPPAASVGRPFLGRPFSVVGVDSAAGQVTLVYRVIGPATAVLARLTPGAEIPLLGPLGRPAPPWWTAGAGEVAPAAAPGERPDRGRPLPLLLVAPGWQVLALRLLAARALAGGVPVSVLALENWEEAESRGGGAPGGCPSAHATRGSQRRTGGAAAPLAAVWDELGPPAPPVRMARVGGGAGSLGELLRRQMGAAPARVVAAGPAGFLRQVQAALAGTAAEGYLVVDAYMPCGYGACLACAVPVRDAAGSVRYERACCEGRWFPAEEVVIP
ncbi:Dihydroorotate dehydrogenase, electron transfer subunit, iron-sulfur cluster binding domain [Thermaerobacter marianensis DSM 12885]|uniref:Dihydroorotate dehydrogenase, electron transfer subunit, iron-sulfur cluster binding domain n=1 Tax=Thermaerobacter marianensis (strain ATCC 700841 / DSM 12885 / JCM 10246 / 7p75a) TaxID=644966 RepID=E6SJH4_THEM7|nr:dihydroorotate dehydrogenase, electron transfer subunit, iron-sulfur cluster binding domain [Thermaerobacter marianensis]ADU52129.1 Dihydroorotate dehydrogenase, electron transfer subunit, iron-sulfur cluster binding domain [Thermaerobacter marianensis DSM 12885]